MHGDETFHTLRSLAIATRFHLTRQSARESSVSFRRKEPRNDSESGDVENPLEIVPTANRCVHSVYDNTSADAEDQSDDQTERELSRAARRDGFARNLCKVDDLYLTRFDRFSHLGLLMLFLEPVSHLLNGRDLLCQTCLFSLGAGS